MKKVKIAFGGGRKLGIKTLKWLSEQNNFEIVAVCPVPEEFDAESHNAFINAANEFQWNVCDISELKNMELDIGLSVNYHKIINKDILELCRKGFYNIHHSYNLRLRGRNITTHAILNTLSEQIFYHGTTLHKMVSQLDAGPIAASRPIQINYYDTAFSLFQKADEEALSLIKEWLPRIAFQEVFLYEPPKEGVHCYRNADLPDRAIDMERMSKEEIDTFIRAFDFPGKEPAFLEAGGEKIHLVYYARGSYRYEYVVKGKTYYTDLS